MNDTSRALCVEYVRNGQWDDVNRLLVHIDEEIRQAAAAVCAGFSSQEELDISPVVENLHKLLSDDQDVAKEAIFALTFHYANRGEIEKTVELLTGDETFVRHITAYALGNVAQKDIDISGAVEALANLFDDESDGVAYCAVRALLMHYAVTDNAERVKALTDHDNAKVADFTASILTDMLIEAAAGANPGALHLWLDLGVAPDTYNDDGETALVRAAIAGNEESVEILLDHGAGLDTLDRPGRSALMHAAYQGRVSVVRLLLDRGADINLVSDAEFTALDYACKGYELEIADLLHQRGGKMGDVDSVLNLVASEGNLPILKIVVEHNPDFSFKDSNDLTALMYAAMKGHTEIVKLLLEKGADPNVAREDGSTAIKYAAMDGRDEIVALLKNHGASDPG